jgi:hypothetical protein
MSKASRPTKATLEDAKAVLDAFCASENGVYLEGDPERLANALDELADRLAYGHHGGDPIIDEHDILSVATLLRNYDP